ncbi:DAK2 domain-containing protein [Cellulomonas aerilata]|uniref:Dihydroxyacetone kinase n=1 Tax=Cellulomonas aerilata TaxID=515326 RepID=A0A512DH00_9CELL|nr:DAK2 domain-containing protein [Cellulomonas aerilata]GEO35767.1 dihydroxyacetone kinase [Cellulomonas aerilata]
MDAGTVRAWATAAARALAGARGSIDSLNVFPVADGDTGTNLALTVAEGAEHAADAAPDAAATEVAAAFARGALRGARGNSGVIVSQYLHGFAAGLAAGGRPSGPATAGASTDATGGGSTDATGGGSTGATAGGQGLVVAGALDEAQRAARAAVARPVEGTILTAATAASAAATRVAREGGDAVATAAAAASAAREALARSTQALDVLRAAGVVDAGASGLVVMLEALAAVVRNAEVRTSEIAAVVARAGAGAGAGAAAGVASASGSPTTVGGGPQAPGHPEAAGDGELEVMFVVEPREAAEAGQARDDLAPALSARMQALGGSVAVVGGSDGWHVHVHTDRPADAIRAGADVGVLSQVVVGRLTSPDADGRDLGVVAATGATGLVADLARAGALVLVLTGAPVRARDVLRVVVDTGARHVVVLPGSPAAAAAARAATGLADVSVDVLDADDDVRVVVAVTAGAGTDVDRVGAMRDALAAVRTTTVEVPDTAAVLGAARALLDDHGGELVTVVAGADLGALAPLRADLVRALGESHPDVEVVVLAGGQPAPAAAVAVE